MAVGSLGLFPKGREAAAEISEARETWSFDAELTPSVTDPDARIVQVRDLRPSA